MILAADVGGTHTRIGLLDPPDLHYIHSLETFRSQDFSDFETLLSRYRDLHHPHVEAACVGVAGPVRMGRSETVNLPWVVDCRVAQRVLAAGAAWVINDLLAMAHGVTGLSEAQVVTLHPGTADAAGNRAVIAAGTGLGEAGLFWDGTRHLPFATEGGHCSFSPLDAVDDEMLLWLRRRYAHVSWERVVSGQGLVNIYEFLRQSGRGSESPLVRQSMEAGDPAAAIAAGAEAGDELCAAAMGRLCRLYGSETANLALKLMATGGVFVGGGIARKNVGALQTGGFVEAFRNKGRMSSLTEAIPVRIIMDELIGLRGAARCAAAKVAEVGSRT
jgi:glucokinase